PRRARPGSRGRDQGDGEAHPSSGPSFPTPDPGSRPGQPAETANRPSRTVSADGASRSPTPGRTHRAHPTPPRRPPEAHSGWGAWTESQAVCVRRLATARAGRRGRRGRHDHRREEHLRAARPWPKGATASTTTREGYYHVVLIASQR